MAEMAVVNDENFDSEILQSDTPAAVMFKSMGCPHCETMKPIMAEVASEYAGRLKIAIADVSECAKKAIQYGILGVPQVLFFKDGERVDVITGAAPKREVVEKVEGLLQ